MRYLPLIAASALLFAVPAKADKFWLSDPAEQAKAAEGSSPDVIEGVLLEETDAGYRIRVVGGELILPKASVFKIEKDAMTAEAVAKAEVKAREASAAADLERRTAQEQMRSTRRARAAEASARREARATDAAMSPAQASPASSYDPILGIATGPASNYVMLRDAQVMWEQTRDRRYLKLVRQLRRLR